MKRFATEIQTNSYAKCQPEGPSETQENAPQTEEKNLPEGQIEKV